MVHQIITDTMRYARRMEDVEAIRAQAKIQAAALSDVFDVHIREAATKGHLREIKGDIAELKEQLNLIFFLVKLILGTTVIMTASVSYMVFLDGG